MTDADRARLDPSDSPAAESTASQWVPRDTVEVVEFTSSVQFPGSTRTTGIYVPARYDATASVSVYASMLLEVFPAVEERTTSTGIRISTDPNDRFAGGLNMEVGAFTFVWQRPGAFRHLCSGIGTIVGMRGGDQCLVLVRKTEPNPIRVSLRDWEFDGLPDPGRGRRLVDGQQSPPTLARVRGIRGASRVRSKRPLRSSHPSALPGRDELAAGRTAHRAARGRYRERHLSCGPCPRGEVAS